MAGVPAELLFNQTQLLSLCFSASGHPLFLLPDIYRPCTTVSSPRYTLNNSEVLVSQLHLRENTEW